MIYARFGADSDVYVFSDGESIYCYGGNHDKQGPYEVLAKNPARMAGHLVSHRAAGDKVPESAIERLSRETAEQAKGSISTK